MPFTRLDSALMACRLSAAVSFCCSPSRHQTEAGERVRLPVVPLFSPYRLQVLHRFLRWKSLPDVALYLASLSSACPMLQDARFVD